MSLNDKNTTIRIAKAIPVTLRQDNSNQEQWMKALTVYAHTNNAVALLTEKNCRSRALTEHDISPAGIMGKSETKIKQEGMPALDEEEKKEQQKQD